MSKVRSPKIGKKVAPAADDNSRPVLTTAFEGIPPREAGHLKGSWSSSAKRMSTETDVSRSLLGGVGEIMGLPTPRLRPRGLCCITSSPCPCAGGTFCAAVLANIAA